MLPPGTETLRLESVRRLWVIARLIKTLGLGADERSSLTSFGKPRVKSLVNSTEGLISGWYLPQHGTSSPQRGSAGVLG